ncbi:hypothetical protein, partial [Moorena bouillonii]|uniref:hypothetical protein n=1 Tax=Moorena bouillonii TaxID=207920 RepID=UPI001300DF3F
YSWQTLGAIDFYFLSVNQGNTTLNNLTIDDSATLSFHNNMREMINLWDQRYGIGIQSHTQYFRTAKNFAWYKDGSHHDNELNAGDGTVQMVIKDGNVGIGTNDPTAKLSIASSTDNRAHDFELKNDQGDTVLLIDAAAGQEAKAVLELTGKGNGSNHGRHAYIVSSSNSANDYATDLGFKVRGGSNYHHDDLSDALTIKYNGNVGIGTTDPGSSKLKIADSTSDFADVRFGSSGMGQLEIVGWSSGWNINAKTDGKHLYLNPDSGSNSNVYIGRHEKQLFVQGSDGNVGIGTTDPGSSKLKVQGNLTVTGSFSASSNTSGERTLLMEAPSDGNHRGDGTQGATGLVYRVAENPPEGDPIFQVRSEGEAVRLFVEHDGWTGSSSNSAWFGGTERAVVPMRKCGSGKMNLVQK